MKIEKTTYSILIPDGEGSSLQNVLYCFSHLKNIRLYVMSTQKNPHLRYSRHVYRFFYFPQKIQVGDWIKDINQVVDEYGIDVIMPIWDKGIKKLIEHKSLLKSDKLIPLPSLDNFITAANKGLLAKHLEGVGIPVPKTVVLSFEIIQNRKQLTLDFPILAKPISSGNGKGIVKFENQEALAKHFENIGLKEEYILQEFKRGVDFCCNVLCYEGEILAYTIQKGTFWDSKPFTAQLGMDFVYNEPLYKMMKKLMKSLHWSGIANIDLLFDPEASVFYVLEINPRFWNSLTASLMAGVNFPQLLIQLTFEKNIEYQGYKQFSYVNLHGLKQVYKKDKAFLLRPGFIWQNTPLRYKIDDPVPIIYKFLRGLKQGIFGKST
jgi:predicted ATP-grasp superfamily ATP-dependent carboligase